MLLLIGGVTLSAYYFRPKTADVGYSPVQPVALSHKLHAGNLGMDCRYCHYSVALGRQRVAANHIHPPTNWSAGSSGS